MRTQQVYYVEWMGRDKIHVQKFHSRGEQLRFAHRLRSPGVRLTSK